MKPSEYRHAKEILGWSHRKMGEVLGKHMRESYRYASGDVKIPKAVDKLLKRIVKDRLTMSRRKFEELVNQL